MTGEKDLELRLRAEWERAIEDAGFVPGDVRVWFVRGGGRREADTGANYYLPHMDLEGEHALSPSQLREAHSDGLRERHRTVVYADYRPPDGPIAPETLHAVFGAMMRHELEHARQQAACGNDVFFVDKEIVDHILRVKFGGLPRSAAYYNVKPMEQDANAAAAMFVRAHHPEHLDAILGGPLAQLARSNTPPERPETLLVRTVAFLYGFRDVCEAEGRRQGVPFVGWLRTYSREAAELWEELEARTN